MAASAEGASESPAPDESAPDESIPVTPSAPASEGGVHTVGEPIFDVLSARVLAAWDDDELHGKLLVHAQETQQLGLAAAFYRRVAEVEPSVEAPAERALDAKKRLGGVVTLALLDIDSQKSDPTIVPGKKAVYTVGIVVALVLLGTALYLLART